MGNRFQVNIFFIEDFFVWEYLRKLIWKWNLFFKWITRNSLWREWTSFWRKWCFWWFQAEETDPIHERLLFLIWHQSFHLLIIYLSFCFNNFFLPTVPYRLHLLLVFKLNCVLMWPLKLKINTSFAFLTFFYLTISLLKCVVFMWKSK
jgi:hypothetical protein